MFKVPCLHICALVASASAFFASSSPAQGKSAYVRVNQVGYEAGNAPYRAYLMSTIPESGATFLVVNSKGATAYSSGIGAQLGTWSHSASLTYYIYALDFTVPAQDSLATPLLFPARPTRARLCSR